ncbi:MAG: Uma2 family endonuclease, partial [Thermoanaerobaculia bacterium]|nr:Uma2 family endonuclease [Thermoanaerobaculia bacterium]
LDRNKKFRAYQTVESLTEYVLVSQDEQLIEVFTRDGKAWRYVAWLPEAGQVALASVPAALAFADVYEAVEFPEAGTA